MSQIPPFAQEFTAVTRTNLGIPNLLSAAIFSRRLGEIESQNKGKDFGDFWDDVMAHATACIFLTTAGLESYINEVFVDRDQHFPEFAKDLMKTLWDVFERKEVIDKFNLALLLRGKPEMATGTKPVQSIRALVSLRNALVHFKPEWSDAQVEHKKLSAKLKPYFKPTPFLSGEELFPRAWASHSCTTWALKAVLRFIDHFENSAGLPHKMTDFANRLRP